ncbi:DUF4339 domain-containing protein [Candidatus Dependentiae bacterium]|nr:DUF4339 domain-containing protein [Candidatus Dependentiae bacterium]
MNEWFLYLNEKQEGPYSTEQIIDFIGQGIINSNSYIFDNSVQNWVMLSQIEQFKAYLKPTYYFYVNNVQSEPLTIDSIKEKLINSELKPEDYIFDSETNQWVLFSASPIYAEIQQQSSFLNTEVAQPAETSSGNNVFPNNESSDNQNKSANKGNEALVSQEKKSESNQKSENTLQNTKINFPCKNHPAKESFLICPECGNDYCDECLVKIGEKHYCKECYSANKDKIEASAGQSKAKGLSFFGKLFKKK